MAVEWINPDDFDGPEDFAQACEADEAAHETAFERARRLGYDHAEAYEAAAEAAR